MQSDQAGPGPGARKSYISKSGVEVMFTPGYYEMPIGYPLGAKTFAEWAAVISDEKKGVSAYPVGGPFFCVKVMTANGVKNLLEECGIDFGRISSMLDLCSGPGLTPRLFKAFGLCDHADGIDMIDRYSEYPDADLPRLQKSIEHILATGERVEVIAEAYRGISERELGLPQVMDWLGRISTVEIPPIDDYFIGDAVDYGYGRKYDLITLTSGREHLDPRALYARVHDLLEPGGIYFEASCHWYQANAANLFLPLDAPWLHACLSYEELLDYYAEVHPEHLEDVKRVMYYKVTHHALADYVAIARECGLVPRGVRRRFDTTITPLMFAPGAMAYAQNDVLPKARRLNPNVEFEDLMSVHYITVYERA